MLREPTALSLHMGFVYFQLRRHDCFLRIFLYGKGMGEQKQQSMKILKQNGREWHTVNFFSACKSGKGKRGGGGK